MMIEARHGILPAAEEEQQHLGESIGALPLQLKSGHVVEIFPSSVVEPIRYLITQGLFRDKLSNRIAITSATSGEGVTYTSRALATTLAHDTRRSVCWVDLNWWSPNYVSRRLLTDHAGIADLLYRKASLEDALISTTNPFLHLMVAGDVDPAQRPVISRGKYLESLITALNERFEYVMLDIPAIKSSSDAIALASLGKSCCMVVKQGVTAASVVGEVLSEIEHIPVMGVLMNQVEYKTPTWIRNFIAAN